MDNKKSDQIEFLYNAISDGQDLIKFTESKVAFIIGVLSAYFAILILSLENIIMYCSKWSFILWVLYAFLILFIIISIWIIAKIIMPIKNPTQCIKISKDHIPDIEFYLAPNEYNSILFPFYNSYSHKLRTEFKSFYDTVITLENDLIIKVLTFELFKVSYIRNIKNDRLRVLVTFILLTSLFLISFYIIYQIELSEIVLKSGLKK